MSRYEVYTGIRYKTQWVSSVCIYSIYSVTNTERVTWYWLGVAFAWVSLNCNRTVITGESFDRERPHRLRQTMSTAFDIVLPQLELESRHLFSVAAAALGSDDTGCTSALGLARLIWSRAREDPTYKVIENSKLLRNILPAVPDLAVGGDGEESPPVQQHLLTLLRWFAPPGDDQSLENMHPVISKSGFVALVGFVDVHKGLEAMLSELKADSEFGTDELRVKASSYRTKKAGECRQREQELGVRQKRRAQFHCNMHRSSGNGSHSVSISR